MHNTVSISERKPVYMSVNSNCSALTVTSTILIANPATETTVCSNNKLILPDRKGFGNYPQLTDNLEYDHPEYFGMRVCSGVYFEA